MGMFYCGGIDPRPIDPKGFLIMPRAVPAVETLNELYKNGSLIIDGGSLVLKVGCSVPLVDETGANVDTEGNTLPADAAPVMVDDVAIVPVAGLVGITEFALKEFVRKHDTEAAKKQELAKKVAALKKAGLSMEDIQAMFQTAPDAAPSTPNPAVVPQQGSTDASTGTAPTVPPSGADTAQQPTTPTPQNPAPEPPPATVTKRGGNKA